MLGGGIQHHLDNALHMAVNGGRGPDIHPMRRTSEERTISTWCFNAVEMVPASQLSTMASVRPADGSQPANSLCRLTPERSRNCRSSATTSRDSMSKQQLCVFMDRPFCTLSKKRNKYLVTQSVKLYPNVRARLFS